MAVNRYDSPAQDRYFNTYVPLPFEQMMPVVAQKEAQLQRGRDVLNKAYEDTANLKYMPGADEEYIKKYVSNVDALVQKYIGQDLTNPIVDNQLRSEFRKMTNRQDIQNIQRNAEKWEMANKARGSLKLAGKYDPLLDEDPAVSWDTVGTGKTYDYMPESAESFAPVSNSFFNNIDKSLFRNAKGDIEYTKEGYILSGRNKGMTDRAIDSRWSTIEDEVGGRQAITRLLKQRGLDPSDASNRETAAKELLRGAAPEFWTENIVGSREPQARSTGSSTRRNTDNYFSPSATVSSPGTAVMDEKYTAKNVYSKQKELESTIKADEGLVKSIRDKDPNDPRLPQMELALQSTRDKKAIFDNTINGPTEYWNDKFDPSYKNAENTFKEATKAKGVPYATAQKQYGEYLALLELDQKLKGNKEGEGFFHGTITHPFKGPYKGLSRFADLSLGTVSAVPAYVENLYAKIKLFPDLSVKLSREIAEAIEGKQGLKEALKNALGEETEIYKQFSKHPLLNKESIFIDKKVRDDVVKYHNAITDLDEEKQKNIDTDIKEGGLKTVSGRRILSSSLGVDEQNQIYYLDDAGKKNYGASSGIARYMKENPASINMVQESATNPDDLKNKNKEIGDLQRDVALATELVPQGFGASLNLDGSLDVQYAIKFRDAKLGTNVTKRNIMVRETNPDFISRYAEDIRNSGHPLEADMIEDPRMSHDIKSHQPKEIGDEYTVTPYKGWYSYKIKKVKNGWDILDESTNWGKVKVGEQEVPTLPTIEDAIRYMYQINAFVGDQMQQVNNAQ